MATERLFPPPGGAKVRMFRTGHGDCFLLAFATADSQKPAYVLIDCGYKPGSPRYIGTTIGGISQAIRDSTDGFIDIAVITHEHQDHVNGITADNFAGITFGQAWFAWTEDPADKFAHQLRVKFKDRLLGLLGARNRLAAAADPAANRRIHFLDELLAFELGGGEEEEGIEPPSGALAAVAVDPSRSKNKISMQVIKQRTETGDIRYLRPHEQVFRIPRAKQVRVFALGPPRDMALLETLDPQGAEEFHLTPEGSVELGATKSPFARRYRLAETDTFDDPLYGPFFRQHFGKTMPGAPPPALPPSGDHAERGFESVPDGAPWRRIDLESIYSPERLALAMNSQTNNSSLVLAFELGKGGKVLLFAADAQRGNWLSWARKDWPDGDDTVTARDLLGRTVLYKVGHHGSHNATLDGKPDADYANLSWMGQGKYGREFTAMITAVRAWADTQNGWDHPLKAIKDALLKKAGGRVFQTDTALAAMQPAPGASAAEWADFQRRAHEDPLFFDYAIEASP